MLLGVSQPGRLFSSRASRARGAAFAACLLACAFARAESLADLLDRQLAEIRAESTEETLANLNRACTQCWLGRTPGDGGFLSDIPLAAPAGAGDIYAVYRERRFLKLLGELQSAEPARAGEMLAAELAESLAEYNMLFAEMVRIQGALDPGAERGRTANGPVFLLDPDPDAANLLGARHKVLAILALIGALRPPGVRPAVEAAVEAAIAQRNWCYEYDRLTLGFRVSAISMAGIYNRQILGGALLATRADSDAIMEKLSNRAVRWTRSEPATRFDELTSFDPPARTGIHRDPSDDGRKTFPVLEPLGDAQFDLLRELAHSGGAQ